MGKGDKKSKRGKIIKGSYGVRRKRKSGKTIMTAPAREVVKMNFLLFIIKIFAGIITSSLAMFLKL